MFVDLSSGGGAGIVTTADDYTPAVIVEDDVKGGSTYDYVPNTVSHQNPHTGVVVAVAVPAALIGCAVLVRKGKRKRGSRR